ncbi:2,3-dihydroxybenzoate-AMP ligase [Baekduia alba]|uniref:(2,3-dihydroxybenzoyl)adenylate synthase n=1 Tax=Baekduia alba TaxID=2997333 RepID=UPI002341F038|nr:AMP-binding protein [Baekduia alba]WCB95230.1 2,3-dihydroxybenzoate-AMP ligase [Baekduia alba]
MTAHPLRRSPTWPAADAARYRAAGLWTGETFGALLADRAARFGPRTAVVGGDERWTYAELDARATALAQGFADLGIAAGDRVVVQLPNIPAYVEVLFGLWRAGALPVFALPAHRRTEMVAFAATAEATAIVTVDRHAGFDHGALARDVTATVPSLRHVVLASELDALRAPAEGALPQARPDAVAFLQLSGGTTGTPKLIPRTHDDYLYSVRESAAICDLTPASVYLCALPAAHNFPMSSPGILGVLHAGGTVVLAPSPEPRAAFALIARERVTITALVPPLLLAWLEARSSDASDDLSSLELLQVGGAKLAPEAARRVAPAFGCRLQQVFGMAEGLVNYTRSDDDDDLVAGTQGRPISDAFDEVRVVDDADADVGDGELGHLLTRGPYTIRGYYDDADPGAFTPDGFYRTGDVVRRLPSGHLVVEGRAKDQINRGGEKIAPDEVEGHLLNHPAVHDVAVVAVPDDRLGERSCAVIVARAEAPAPPTAGDVRRFLRERGVAAYKVPDRVAVVAEFPLTGVGKVSRRDLRAAVAASLIEEPV